MTVITRLNKDQYVLIELKQPVELGNAFFKCPAASLFLVKPDSATTDFELDYITSVSMIDDFVHVMKKHGKIRTDGRVDIGQASAVIRPHMDTIARWVQRVEVFG